jgi:hypothetical protein
VKLGVLAACVSPFAALVLFGLVSGDPPWAKESRAADAARSPGVSQAAPIATPPGAAVLPSVSAAPLRGTSTQAPAPTVGQDATKSQAPSGAAVVVEPSTVGPAAVVEPSTVAPATVVGPRAPGGAVAAEAGPSASSVFAGPGPGMTAWRDSAASFGSGALQTPPPQAVTPSQFQLAAPTAPAYAGASAPNEAMAGWGAAPAPLIDPRRFSEAHWQGLELVPKTPALAESLGLPPNLEGVILDDVSLPADLAGFRAGDVLTAVDNVPTPDLLSFIKAADRVRDLRQVAVSVYRAEAMQSLVLVSLFERLGTANGETPTMIPPGARRPHRYQGPCTKCHRIGTTGSLANDQGDTAGTMAPAIRATDVSPHRSRGPCSACHQLIP